MKTATIYLIPLPISEDAFHTLSPEVSKTIAGISHYFAENIRTARRFIKALNPEMKIEELQFLEISKHEGTDLKTFRNWIKEGHQVGIMSEAGCPGIADPGADLISIAQEMNVTVHPLVGPSSIILSLMASGLNGQNFAFVGYLPVKEPERSQRIKNLENISRKEKQTQLFIETPYRNDKLLEEVLKACSDSTKLCIAIDITGKNESVKTKTISDWKKNKPTIGKHPTVFLILA
jgi:16S rRNA (cytidine1402-2'-O)-methyltransferase